MIQTVVSNASAPEYGQATISFPIREEDYPSVVNMLQRMGLGDPLERDCRVDEVCGNWPILKRLEKVAINLDEMDYLAKRLDSFDAQEKAKFQAAAVRFGLFDMRHLIDLTFCCQETTVITDFSDLEKVGRRHYLDVNGSSAPSEELENVDGYTDCDELRQDDEDSFCESRHNLQESNGRVCNKKSDGRGCDGVLVSRCLGCYQSGRNRQSGLFSCPEETGGAWNLLYQLRCPTVGQLRLCGVRFADRHGPGQCPQYAPHFLWRPRGEDSSVDGVCWPTRPRGCRPMVHRRLRVHMERCVGGLSRAG